MITNKNKLLLIYIILIPLTILIILLLIIFRPNEKIDYISSKNENIIKNTTKEQFKKASIKVKEIENTKNAMEYPAPRKDIKFNTSTPAPVKDMNKHIYQIVDKYFNPDLFKIINKDYSDPLYIMSVSNVEFGGVNNPKILYAPALPTAMGYPASVENIDTFGVGKALNAGSYLKEDADDYMGPLQMSKYLSIKGGDDHGRPISEKDLKGTEMDRILAAIDSGAKRPSWLREGLYTRTIGSNESNSMNNTGDRYNYADAVNRICGKILSNTDRYIKSSQVDKSENYNILKNKYTFMAATSISHNTGEATLLDNSDHSNLYWWPWGNSKNARQYAVAIGSSKDIINDLDNRAKASIENYRKGGEFKFLIYRQEGIKIAREYMSKGYIPSGLFSLNNESHEEKVAYPIQILYNYFVLNRLYSGE